MRFLFFLLVPFCALGQDRKDFANVIATHAVKTSPLHLANFYPTIQIAYEFKVGQRTTFQADLGYVLPWHGNDAEFKDKRGFKVKLEPRYYLLANAKNNLSLYLAAEAYLNYVNFDREDVVEECFDLDCQHTYSRRYFYRVRYREPGFGVKFGFQKYFSDFLIDINTGWAIRFVSYHKPGAAPSFAEDEVEWFEVPNEKNRTALMPLIGMRVGYRIK